LGLVLLLRGVFFLDYKNYFIFYNFVRGVFLELFSIKIMNKTRINTIISLEDIEKLKIQKIKGSWTNTKVQGSI